MTSLATPTSLVVPAGGAGVMMRLLHERCGYDLTTDQANTLWAEVSAVLQSRELGETVQEAEETQTGRLDTLPRGDVLDALSHLMTSEPWPCGFTHEDDVKAWARKMGEALRGRGYALSPEES